MYRLVLQETKARSSHVPVDARHLFAPNARITSLREAARRCGGGSVGVAYADWRRLQHVGDVDYDYDFTRQDASRILFCARAYRAEEE